MSLISLICANHNDPQLAEFSPQKTVGFSKGILPKKDWCQGFRIIGNLPRSITPPKKTDESSPKKGIIYIKDMNHFPTIRVPNQHGTFSNHIIFQDISFSNQIT